jgi:hypothetical protein
MLKLVLDQRTKLDDNRMGFQDTPSAELPRTPYSFDDIRYVYHNSGTIKRCVMALREECFRKGYEIKPKYKCKCKVCSQEYDHRPESGNCDNKIVNPYGVKVECNGELIEPDPLEKKRVEKFFTSVNANFQNLLQVLKQLEDDVNIHDDAWMLIRQEYDVTDYGDIVKTQVKEIVRASPKYMQFIRRPDGVLGHKYGVCLMHRDKVYDYQDKVCPVCGRGLHDVIAISVDVGGNQSTPKNFYIKDEVVHFSKYSPSMTIGYSPIATLWDTAVSLIKMVEYIYTSYDKRRIPAGVIAAKINTLVHGIHRCQQMRGKVLNAVGVVHDTVN